VATVPRPFPPAPFQAPTAGDIDQRLSQIADAINRKADSTALPTFSAIYLRASNGSTWRVGISTAGALVIDQVVP
jgi:hypothetical protein